MSRRIATSIADYGDADSMGSKLRARRIQPLITMIRSVSSSAGKTRIIDIGGTDTYWGIVPKEFLDEMKVEVTIVNIPGSGSRKDEREGFRYVEADGCDLEEFGDNSFDIAHSNSVIEHVGDWARMQAFAREISRVAPRHFIQTPNFWFPVEPHCMTPLFHWLPKPTRVWLVSRFQLGHWARAGDTVEAVEIVDSARLLSRKMFAALFPQSQIITERFAGLPKSFVAVKGQG